MREGSAIAELRRLVGPVQERKEGLIASIRQTMQDVQRHYEPERRILLENVPVSRTRLLAPDMHLRAFLQQPLRAGARRRSLHAAGPLLQPRPLDR